MSAAFTRVDLLVLVAVSALVFVWLACTGAGERVRAVRCSRNLAIIGRALQTFANDHRHCLPPAALVPLNLTWDTILRPYLRSETIVSNSPYAVRQLQRAVAPRFRCPSDSVLRERLRSYAMARHDMRPENWPPGPDNATGLGLWWGKPEMTRALENPGSSTPEDTAERLAMVKLDWLPAPADTLLVTEFIDSDNKLWNVNGSGVTSPDQQLKAFPGGMAGFHHGRFNYLLVDGHVEALTPLNSAVSGIWTIKAGD